MTSHRPTAWADLEVESRFPESDRPWVSRAILAFVEEDVDPDAGAEALGEAARIRDEAGRPCVEVFGPAEEWVDATTRGWSESGTPRPAAPTRLGWWGYLTIALAFAAFVPVGLFFLAVVDGRTTEDVTLALAAMPLLGAVPVVLLGIHEHYVWSRSRRAAAMITGVVAAVLLVGLTALLVLGDEIHLGTMPAWGWWAVAVALAFCGIALGCLVQGGLRPHPDVTDDEAWFQRVGAELRTRRAFGDARVAQVLAEARSHVAESGRSARAELGDPTVYALAFTPQAGANNKRVAVVSGAVAAFLVVVNLVTLVTTGEAAWLTLALAGVMAVQAWSQWRQGEQARAQQSARNARF